MRGLTLLAQHLDEAIASAYYSWNEYLSDLARMLRATEVRMHWRDAATGALYTDRSTNKHLPPKRTQGPAKFGRTFSAQLDDMTIEAEMAQVPESQWFLSELLPHLQRATSIRQRLSDGAQRNDQIAAALANLLDIGVFLVHLPSLSITQANDKARTLGVTAGLFAIAPTINVGAGNAKAKPALPVPSPTLALLKYLEEAKQSVLHESQAGASSLIHYSTTPTNASNAWVALSFVPLRRFTPHASHKAQHAYAVGYLAAPGELPQVQVRYLRREYQLSQKETRLAVGLAEGLGLEVMADRFNVSRNTLRAQLQGVLRKTNTGSQTELIALLLDDPRLILAPPELVTTDKEAL